MRPEKQEAEAGPQRSAPLGNHTKPPISVWRFGGLDMPEYEYACSGAAEKPNTHGSGACETDNITTINIAAFHFSCRCLALFSYCVFQETKIKLCLLHQANEMQ